MRNNILLIVLLLSAPLLWSQDSPSDEGFGEEGAKSKEFTSLRKSKDDEKEKPPITDYKIISIKNDTTYVDTTLTIQKDYKFNYLRRDHFELMPVHNVAQTYVSLSKREERDHLLPLFGARARHFNFMEADDILYYNVPSPLTELYFNTTFEQGQQLDSFITINTSPGLNLSIAYKGVRSLGKYQHALTSTGNFRATASFNTKNKRYKVRTHFVSQDLLNQENGGLSEEGINQYLGTGLFVGQDDEFSDRGAITVNFEDAESTLYGKRFYINHEYAIIKKTDSTNTNLSLGHILDITDKKFLFTQSAVNYSDIFGEAYESDEIRDRVALEDFTNYVFLDLTNTWLGHIRVKGGYSDYNYGYNSVLTQIDDLGNEINITNRIKGDVYSVGGEYQNSFKGLEVFGEGMTTTTGGFEGYYLNAGARYTLKEKYRAEAILSSNSVAPNYNFLLYQSDYVNYNWQRDFSNTETQTLQVNLEADRIAKIEASYSSIDGYTYFGEDANGGIAPLQTTERIDLLKVKLTNAIKFWKFGLDNTVMYQQVEGGDQIYNVPEIITRNSLYYQDEWFKKAMFLQTGATLRYFTSYTADAYDPILSEFYTQNTQQIGGYPQIDLFFNAKVRQTRIFFKVENFGEAFNQNREFSAPGYASRDAVLRFGIVWNFFL